MKSTTGSVVALVASAGLALAGCGGGDATTPATGGGGAAAGAGADGGATAAMVKFKCSKPDCKQTKDAKVGDAPQC